MSKENLIKKYKERIKKLNKYIASSEECLFYLEKRYGVKSENYQSAYTYYMELIVECNTCYDIVDDLRKLEGGDDNE